MQKSLRVVDNWNATKELSIDPEKIEVALLLTRKRKTKGVVRLEYQSVKLNLLKEVNYLGANLDNKLMWKAHLKTWVKKEQKSLWLFNAFISRELGTDTQHNLLAPETNEIF